MRIVVFALLFAAVYSWEEIVAVVLGIIRKFSGNKRPMHHSTETDEFVSTAVIIFAIPLSILYFLNSDASLAWKLALAAIQLLLIAVLSSGAKLFARRIKDINNYNGWEKVGLVLYAGGGLISPMMRLYSGHPHSLPQAAGRFAAYLSVPLIIGFGLVTFFNRTDPQDILPNADGLIITLVGGLFIIITVDFLEKHLHLARRPLLGYIRIALGIVLIFILSEGLV